MLPRTPTCPSPSGVRGRSMIDQPVDGLDHRIVHVGRNGISGESQLRGLIFAAHLIAADEDSRRDADGGRASGNVAHDDGIRADLGAISH